MKGTILRKQKATHNHAGQITNVYKVLFMSLFCSLPRLESSCGVSINLLTNSHLLHHRLMIIYSFISGSGLRSRGSPSPKNPWKTETTTARSRFTVVYNLHASTKVTLAKISKFLRGKLVVEVPIQSRRKFGYMSSIWGTQPMFASGSFFIIISRNGMFAEMVWTCGCIDQAIKWWHDEKPKSSWLEYFPSLQNLLGLSETR